MSFKYLGSTVSENARFKDELSLGMGGATAVFGNLRERLGDNRHIPVFVKCNVYRATVLAGLERLAEEIRLLDSCPSVDVSKMIQDNYFYVTFLSNESSNLFPSDLKSHYRLALPR